MAKRLTPRAKNWIFYNIKRFHSDDLFLKHLDAEIINSDLKLFIYESSDSEELLKKLNSNGYNKDFSFYRKDGNRFCYPSLFDQVKSLIECWDEIRLVYQDMYQGHESEYEQVEDEPFGDTKEARIPSLKRKTFGNKANINSSPALNEISTLHRHIMSSNKYIKSSFGFEYNSFKKRCLKELGKIEDRTKWYSYFFQTDLKSFYHNLNTATIIKILSGYDVPTTKRWLSELGKKYKEDGLPIGWILSGFVADIVMVEFSKFIEEKYENFVSELSVSRVEMISYVDDLIFFIGSSNEIVDKNKFLKNASDIVQLFVSSFFDGSNIEIHKHDSPKVKFLYISSQSASLLKTNWHEIDMFASIAEDSISGKKWTMLDEFLLPSDNDLFLNEKAQFLSNVRNLRVQVENGEFKNTENFWPYLERVLYKISIDKKYLQSVFDLIFSFLERVDDEDETELIDKVWKRVKELDDINVIDIMQFLRSLINFSDRSSGFYETTNKIVRDSIEFIRTKPKFTNTDDIVLLGAFLENIQLRRNIDLSDIQLHPVGRDLYFRFSSVISLECLNIFGSDRNGDWKSLNPFLLSEVLRILSRRYGVDEDSVINFLERSLNFIKGKKKTRFIKLFFEDIACDLLPGLPRDALDRIVSYLEKFKVSGAFFNELSSIVRNYNFISDVFSKTQVELFNKYVLSLNYSDSEYKYRRPKGFNFRILTASAKQYLYYKEVSTNILFAMSNIRDALRFVFFQYRPIESVVFISWKSLPNAFNGVSHISLDISKELLRLKSKTMIVSKIEQGLDGFPVQRFKAAVEDISKGRLTFIDMDFFDSNIAGKNKGFESEKIKLMIGNLEIDVNSELDKYNNFRLKSRVRNRINREVMRVLRLAVANKCQAVCFPELTIPHAYMGSYLKFCGMNNLIFIAGLEYFDVTTEQVLNPSVISFPTNPATNPLNKFYHAYIQFKNFLSIKEIDVFNKISNNRGNPIELLGGSEIYVFKDRLVDNFSVLTCSDFLSLEIKYQLQGEVQTLFVPAMNYDNTTYYHVAQAAIRELYCICVICNNSSMGASLVCCPYRDEYQRMMFRIEGISQPKSHHLTIIPSVISELQKMGLDRNFHFENEKTPLLSDSELKPLKFKQPPPDWYFAVGKKKKSN